LNKRAAVIGSGLGGLSAAIRLASRGFRVEVYETNGGPGGKAHSFTEAGFRFDTGPSLITMPFVIKELFDYANDDINSYITFEKLEILCKYFFTDGTTINAYSEIAKLIKEVESKTSDTAEHLIKYLDHCRNIYELTSRIFLFSSLHEISSYLNFKAFKTLLQIFRIDPFRTMNQANSSYFKDEKLIQLFNRYATYNGSNPFLAPATLNIIPHVEYNLGGFVIKGGVYNLSLALYKLALNKGAEFHFNSRVEKIETKNGRVRSIETVKEKKKFDIIISNADVHNTYKFLLNDVHSRHAKRYMNLEPSSSALVFYWGIKSVTNSLEIHNIIFSGNYKKEFEELFGRKTIPDDPTVYIYISSRFNPADAPAGFENWFVMINAPYENGQDWEKDIARARAVMINKIKESLGIDIDKLIVYEKILTPIELEKQTGSFKGSIYGISSNSRKAAFLRHPNRSKRYRGLYFCGGSAHPGGGIPLVILSGKIAAELVFKYEK